MALTTADQLLNTVYNQLNIAAFSDEQKYDRITSIVSELFTLNAANAITGKTTGTISERLCELALKARVPRIYNRISDRWNWMADFSVSGDPFNLLISVKSFKAKERLLVSGSGNILSPTIGWGLMDDINEWTEQRTRTYLFRGFIAIYMPASTFTQIANSSKAVNNINGKPLLRELGNFMDDLTNSLNRKRLIDISLF